MREWDREREREKGRLTDGGDRKTDRQTDTLHYIKTLLFNLIGVNNII